MAWDALFLKGVEVLLLQISMKRFKRLGQRILSVLLLITAIRIAAKQFQPDPELIQQEDFAELRSGSSGSNGVFQSTAWWNPENPLFDPTIRVPDSSTRSNDSSEVLSSVLTAGSVPFSAHQFSANHPADLVPTGSNFPRGAFAIHALSTPGTPRPSSSTSLLRPSVSGSSGSVRIVQRSSAPVILGKR